MKIYGITPRKEILSWRKIQGKIRKVLDSIIVQYVKGVKSTQFKSSNITEVSILQVLTIEQIKTATDIVLTSIVS